MHPDTFPSLYRLAAQPMADDLGLQDLPGLYRLLCQENLVPVFFHDGSVTSQSDFMSWALAPGRWLYAAAHRGRFIGLGVVDGFSTSGNSAYTHLVSFRAGRQPLPDHFWQEGNLPLAHPLPAPAGRTLFGLAGCLWFDLLARRSCLRNLLAVLPGPYRQARKFAEAFGFIHTLTLPGALLLQRAGRPRVADARVYHKTL